jgi:hypothetical protein
MRRARYLAGADTSLEVESARECRCCGGLMALEEFHQRELTEADKLFVFERATQGTSGAAQRWTERARLPMADADLKEALEYEIGAYGGCCGPNQPDVEYQCRGLRIWGG